MNIKNIDSKFNYAKNIFSIKYRFNINAMPIYGKFILDLNTLSFSDNIHYTLAYNTDLDNYIIVKKKSDLSISFLNMNDTNYTVGATISLKPYPKEITFTSGFMCKLSNNAKFGIKFLLSKSDIMSYMNWVYRLAVNMPLNITSLITMDMYNLGIYAYRRLTDKMSFGVCYDSEHITELVIKYEDENKLKIASKINFNSISASITALTTSTSILSLGLCVYFIIK